MNANNNISALSQKANKDLTPQERKAKRELKRQLKVQQKRQRLETKLRHAITRSDSHTEAETRKALQKFDEKQDIVHCNRDKKIIRPLEETPEREFVMNICAELQRKQQQGNTTNKETKQVQTDQAVALLRNMSKGTQEKHMFQDANTLLGYSRQKFFERAMLVCNSFLKLRPNTNNASSVNNEDTELRKSVWDRLCSVRRVCSVGCGPGNDAVGVVAFLKAIGKGSPQLEHAILLDWAMDDWKLVIDPLCDIVVPDHVQAMETSTCDVSESLLESVANRQAKELLLDNDASESNVDLFLISYLLTEVRGQWQEFVKEMIQVSKPNTLFYLAEPVPWQLHRIKELYKDLLEFIWLDSSMNQPEMQPLDNRLGPGVLLGRKRVID